VTLSVCVFCSSADGLPEEYRSAARDLGAELARRGHRLVYGGGNVGLMGEVARSVHSHGGTVVGVIPQGLVDRELAYDPADELLVTQTLRATTTRFWARVPGRRRGGPARHPVAGAGLARVQAGRRSPRPDRHQLAVPEVVAWPPVTLIWAARVQARG
jgi:hypothetical protein